MLHPETLACLLVTALALGLECTRMPTSPPQMMLAFLAGSQVGLVIADLLLRGAHGH